MVVAHRDGGEHHRVAELDECGSGGLLGHAARLDDELASRERFLNALHHCFVPELGWRGNTKRAGRNRCARAIVLMSGLVPQAQFLDDLAVVVDIRALQVVEQTATLSDHLEEATTTVVILLVGAEVVRQIVDALCEQRDLNASRSTVGLVRPVLLDGRAFSKAIVLVSPRANGRRRCRFCVIA